LFKLDFEQAFDMVNWNFFSEVLCCKVLDACYIHRISQMVSGAQSVISINMEVGSYFRNKKMGASGGPPLAADI
jgi:hypothetical protein